jgi:hypothetical protein
MKDLRGAAGADVDRPIEACFAMLLDVAAYPDWYPQVVRAVEILESGPDAVATRARAELHVAQGPLVKDFDLVLAVRASAPEAVTLTRIAAGGGEEFEVAWRLDERDRTRISLELRASLPVPRLLPLGDIGNAIAAGFVDAAVARLGSEPPAQPLR